MFPHDVKITYNTWGSDVDGGRIVASTTTKPSVPCFVQPSAPPQSRMRSAADVGDRRITHVLYWTCRFRQNPNLNVDDIVTWIDKDNGNSTTHNIVVTGWLPETGLHCIWVVVGEERM
jgi:hypothetical protein